MFKKLREPINSLTHWLGALLALIGLIALLIVGWSTPAKIISLTIYGLSLIFLFSASATYHMVLAKDKAAAVDELNSSRKDFDTNITEEALALIEAQENYADARTTVLFKSDWHKGVIGIVASRCIEKYYRPTIILTESHGLATGSARSVKGFDLHDAITQCEDLLVQFGGHMYAAGLTLKKENLEAFKKKFEQVVADKIEEHMLSPSLEIDGVLKVNNINTNFFKVLEQMSPFGPGNAQPLFVLKNVKAKAVRLLKEQHVKFDVVEEGNKHAVAAIGFQMAQFYKPLFDGKSFDLCFQIQENDYLGQKTLQLSVKDIKFIENSAS